LIAASSSQCHSVYVIFLPSGIGLPQGRASGPRAVCVVTALRSAAIMLTLWAAPSPSGTRPPAPSFLPLSLFLGLPLSLPPPPLSLSLCLSVSLSLSFSLSLILSLSFSLILSYSLSFSLSHSVPLSLMLSLSPSLSVSPSRSLSESLSLFLRLESQDNAKPIMIARGLPATRAMPRPMRAYIRNNCQCVQVCENERYRSTAKPCHGGRRDGGRGRGRGGGGGERAHLPPSLRQEPRRRARTPPGRPNFPAAAAAAMAVMWEDPGVQACQGLEISERRPAGVPGVDVPVRQRRKASSNLKTQWPTLGTL
jgi:hypothetical protein